MTAVIETLKHVGTFQRGNTKTERLILGRVFACQNVLVKEHPTAEHDPIRVAIRFHHHTLLVPIGNSRHYGGCVVHHIFAVAFQPKGRKITMTKMTKTDYVKIAISLNKVFSMNVIKGVSGTSPAITPIQALEIVYTLMDDLSKDNPKFDKKQFTDVAFDGFDFYK
jgi:hypothetical protein